MKRIFLDIETLPPIDKCGHVACADLPCCNDEDFRKLALRGESGRVLCIGLIVEQDGEILHKGILGRDRATLRFHLDEERTLRAFWRLFDGFNPRQDQVIGHNIYDFDLLFLYKRSVVHRVRPYVTLSFARYRSQPIFDTMREWEKWGRSMVSLDNLARALGLESSKQGGITGATVFDHYCAGEHVAIADYCMRDVELTRNIYYRMCFEECAVAVA